MMHSHQIRKHDTKSSVCHYSGKVVYTSQNNTLVNHLSDFTLQPHFSTSLANRHIKYITRLIAYACQHMEIINRNIFVGACIGNLYNLLGYDRPLAFKS